MTIATSTAAVVRILPPLFFSNHSSGVLPTYNVNTSRRQQSRRGSRCFAISPPSKKRKDDENEAAAGNSDDNRNSAMAVDCVIVGAGISGLCIAQALTAKHDVARLIVTEARDRVGGNIITVERDGYLWEEGPNSFQPSDAMLTTAMECGLNDELVLGDPTAPRFVLWDGKLRPVPSKPTDLPFFDLMTFGGKLRAALGALGFRPFPPVSSSPPPPPSMSLTYKNLLSSPLLFF